MGKPCIVRWAFGTIGASILRRVCGWQRGNAKAVDDMFQTVCACEPSETTNIARVSNLAIKMALETDAEWFVGAGGDIAVLTPIVNSRPLPHIGGLPILKTSENMQVAPGVLAWSGGWIAHRRVLADSRYCEDFVGYGFQDTDFALNVLMMNDPQTVPFNVLFPPGPLGMPPHGCIGVHLHHKSRDWENDYYGYQRNKKLFVKRLAYSGRYPWWVLPSDLRDACKPDCNDEEEAGATQ